MSILKILIYMGLLSFFFGCGDKNANPQKNEQVENTPISIPVENISATKDQKERRLRSEAICKAKAIPVYKNPNSLFVSPEAEVTLRAKEKVVDRAIALFLMGLKSEGVGQEKLGPIIKAFDIYPKLSPEEKTYIEANSPTQQQTVNANWRYEGLHVLLWSLGYIDELVFPDQLCNVGNDVKIIYESGPKKFSAQSKLRSKAEILDQADLILRLNWACVNARVKNEKAPGRLVASVVYERHYTLNWLIQYLNQDWDNVSTDT